MSIAATYVSATSFSVAADKAAEFVVGVRVQADCGVDGVKYGTVTDVSQPTSMSNSVYAGGDDGHWIGTDATASGFNGSSSYIYLGYNSATETCRGFVRFSSVTIAKNATASNGRIGFRFREYGTQPVTVRIHAVLDDNPAAPTSGAACVGLALSTEYVEWTIPTGLSDMSAVQTPDISSLITLLAARAGWVSGNAMLFVLRPVTPTSSQLVYLYSYNGGNAPSLQYDIEPDAYTVTVALDSGSLTSNLTGVLHGNDVPASLCNHGHTGAADGGTLSAYISKSLLTAPGDIIVATAAGTPGVLGVGAIGAPLIVSPSGVPAYGQRGPGCYFRDTRLAAKTVSVAADRYCLLSPNRMLVDINGIYVELTAQQTLDLSLAATWDSVTTDYRVAAARAGKDFYVYACIVSGALKLLVSANATYPSGFDATTSRKIGGFHCLCVAVGTISGHTLSGYLAGDILPASVWDLKHRPVCAPEGMVYVAGVGKWVDIYLASVSGGALVSVYNATCADGASSPAFHWYKFSQWLGQIGKRMLTQTEFVAASLGSNQGTNITGSADPGTTGGKTDTAGRRMISNVGCEDCCGNLWQWGEEAGGGASSAAWVNAFDGNDSGVAGQHYQAPNRALLGGGWDLGASCGSRGSAWSNGPLNLAASVGARGVAEPLAA